MNNPLLQKLEHCENTLDFLTIDKGEGPLVWDIKVLSEMLPLIVTEADGREEQWGRFIIPFGWVLRHLQEIYNEVKPQGAKA